MSRCCVCYDAKGIQQFIFSVPKLKYMVGASSLIHDFDTGWAAGNVPAGVELIYAGGGKGAFTCDDEQAADELRLLLVQKAHGIGLDLRLYQGPTLSKAMHGDEVLYPFVPDGLEGEPCRASGLWPVEDEGCGYPTEGKGIHPVVWERAQQRTKDPLGQRILRDLQGMEGMPGALTPEKAEFLSAVKADGELDSESRAAADAGDYALGLRNRWAIVAMDGNDMGAQHRTYEDAHRNAPEAEKTAWYKAMSAALYTCTRQSFLHALGKMLAAWWKAVEEGGAAARGLVTYTGSEEEERMVLPFRPLILGGDDVLCLCHVKYAMTFARDLAAEFSRLSREEEKKAGMPLWPATGGELTISAGIVYAGVAYPLHTAIPYAESLLASAKGKFRDPHREGAPSPAGVDWEHVTDNLLDTPAARRQRDLVFIDDDLDGTEIQLTRRPYGLAAEAFKNLLDMKEALGELPRSTCAQVLPGLRHSWAERTCWLAAAQKHHQNEVLVRYLSEPLPGKTEKPQGSDWREGRDSTGKEGARNTGVPDAILLLEEERRMAQD